MPGNNEDHLNEELSVGFLIFWLSAKQSISKLLNLLNKCRKKYLKCSWCCLKFSRFVFSSGVWAHSVVFSKSSNMLPESHASFTANAIPRHVSHKNML